MILLRFRKVGRVQCGGARETRERRVRIERLLAKPRTFSNLAAFLNLNGIILLSESLLNFDFEYFYFTVLKKSLCKCEFSFNFLRFKNFSNGCENIRIHNECLDSTIPPFIFRRSNGIYNCLRKTKIGSFW